MDYEELIAELKDIVENSKYADFCIRDVHDTISKYLETHSLTLPELKDIFFFLSEAVEEKIDYELEQDWENWNEENE